MSDTQLVLSNLNILLKTFYKQCFEYNLHRAQRGAKCVCTGIVESSKKYIPYIYDVKILFLLSFPVSHDNKLILADQ